MSSATIEKAADQRHPTRRSSVESLRLPVLMTLPTLVIVFVVIGIPLVYSLALSLHRINMLTQQWIFVGLQNYLEILPQPDFLYAMGRTLYFAVVTVSGGLALGMAMALVLNQRFWGRGVLRSFVLIPWAISPVAVGILWGWMLNGNYGTFNGILTDLGLVEKPIAWLANGWAALNLVALVHIWNQAPLASLLILAGLQSMPENLRRAARIDGAGPLVRFQDHSALAAADAALVLI
ncbi:MAG: sugar ABC transporter permease [Geminicoccaceae bacterium]